MDGKQPHPFSQILALHETRRRQKPFLSDLPRVHINEATRAVAELYERTRNTLEYHDADIVRRMAIERTLKRLLAFGMLGGDVTHAENLLKELIRGGYFPNDEVPEERTYDIARITRRFLIANAVGIPKEIGSLFLSLTAIAIEDAVVVEEREMEQRFIQFSFTVLRDRIPWNERERKDRRHTAMLYAEVWRDILYADERRTIAALVHNAVIGWEDAEQEHEVRELLPQVINTIRASRILLRLPEFMARRRVARSFGPSFIALRDVLRMHPDDIGEVASSPLLFEELLENTIQRRSAQLSRDLRWTALRATLYIFLTKMLIGFSIKAPYEMFVLCSFHVPAFIVNLAIPPLIMLVMALSAPRVSQKIVAKIVDTALLLAFEEGSLEMPRRVPRRTSLRTMFYSVAAVTLTLGILWGVARALAALNFSWLGIGVFVFFMSLVSLFAWRVRKPLRDMGLAGSREGFFAVVAEIIAFPFLAAGRLLSTLLSGFSLFLFMVDVFIETPLKFFLGFVEDWLVFLREKRE